MSVLELPNLKELDLFADICTELRSGDIQLKDVAMRLGRAPSTISECVKSLEKQYKVRDLLTGSRYPKPTVEADQLLDMFNRIVELHRDVGVSAGATHHDIRILTTRSLQSRLFSGPVSAFMMWLRNDPKNRDTARVTVFACDHNDVMVRLTERGVNSYHWGVCWNLPQAGTNSYLDFTDIPLPDTPSTDAAGVDLCSTPILAVTSDLDFGLQGEELKKVFRSGPQIQAADLWPCLHKETVALVNTEPEDALRAGLLGAINRAKTISVTQYEDALHHVRSMDANLTFGPGWFRYRFHVAARYVQVGNGSDPHYRKVQLVRRKSMLDGRGGDMLLRELPRPVLAFYVILRLFLSEHKKPFSFAELLFANGSSPKQKAQLMKGMNAPDPAIVEISPKSISDWIREKMEAGVIDTAIQNIKDGKIL